MPKSKLSSKRKKSTRSVTKRVSSGSRSVSAQKLRTSSNQPMILLAVVFLVIGSLALVYFKNQPPKLQEVPIGINEISFSEDLPIDDSEEEGDLSPDLLESDNLDQITEQELNELFSDPDLADSPADDQIDDAETSELLNI